MTASSPSIAPKETSPLMRFFSNPVVGVIGTLASIVGVLLAIYFYFQGTKFRELVYYVNPAQAIVVKTGEASRLRVLMGERELKSDVTTAQIAIWNRGTESLKPTDVLAPITIRTSPSVPILEATLRKKSREVVNVSLDQSHLADGVVGISWNIFEQGDGGVIQIVYAGSPENTKINLQGVVEGQHAIRQLQYSGTIKSVADQVREQRGDAYSYSLFLTFGIIGLARFIYVWSKSGFKTAIPSLLFTIMWFGIGIYLFFSRMPDPPFGF